MVLSREEKLACLNSLNWDHTTSPEDMLTVLEGGVEKAGPFDRKTLLVRSLERLHWEYVVALWGIEKIKALYTPELSRRIWPKGRRRLFDFAVGILRKEPVSPAGWGSEHYQSKRNRFFSDRRNRP
ncbi:MAG: hypothetical protein LBE10_06890 [Treponema sp.]|nr:hypothetical protein [Treponema sp.]